MLICIQSVPELNETTYYPNGMTAMNDGIGVAIDKAGERLSKTKEEDRPSKVIVLIITDGDENYSKEYTGTKIKEMIDTQQNTFNWEFIFLGANVNVEQIAKDYGFKEGKFASYNQTVKGTLATFDSMTMAVTSERGFTKSAGGDLSRGIGDLHYNLQDEYDKSEKK